MICMHILTYMQTTSPVEVGRATGELCSAMGRVVVDMEAPIAPYYELFKVHHGIGGDAGKEGGGEGGVCGGGGEWGGASGGRIRVVV